MGRTGKVYRRIRASLTDKPTFFTWVRDGRLAASGRPYSKSQVDWAKEKGVTAILSLTEEPLPSGWTLGLETRHISMKDHAPVSHSDMLLGADYIASALSEGKVVLVHCLAGKGRTGCVLAAYLIAHEGKTARQAIDELRAAREGSVERQQEQRVLEFEAEALKARSPGTPRRETTPRTRP
ncbi:MAG TPA: dual specificity protein phosphatase family protein [Nitrososphaerales archaeon]|nr:dual specificity protein phosphatase family protein [Nitrososphaerales archaeon]